MVRHSRLWMLLSLLIYGTIHGNDASSEHALNEALFKNYVKEIRPVKDTSTKTILQIHSQIYNILSVNGQEESIDLILWTALTWQDEFLQWNASNFNNYSSLYTLASKLWQPDYFIMNQLDSKPIVSSDTLYAYISYDGTVAMWLSSHLTLRCTLDITLFPFDTQTCPIVGSIWMYDSEKLRLTLSSLNTSLADVFTGAAEFETLNFVSEQKNYLDEISNSTYSQLYYYLTLRRRPEYYIFVLIVPSFLLTSLCIIGIFTPNANIDERNEKMTLGLTTLLSMAVILNIVADEMPKSSTGLPLLGYYVLYEIAVCSVATILSTVIIFVHHRAVTREWNPPAFIRWIGTLELHCKCKNEVKLLSKTGRNLSLHQQKLWSSNQQIQQNAYNPEMITVLNNTVNGEAVIVYLQKIVKMIDDHVKELYRDAENRKIWTTALDRTDMFLLVFLFLFNCILTYVILL